LDVELQRRHSAFPRDRHYMNWRTTVDEDEQYCFNVACRNVTVQRRC